MGFIDGFRPENAAVVGFLPSLWLRAKTAVKNFRLRNDKDAVEGHRVIDDK